MSRADREAQARVDGMQYAVRQIKQIGLEAFERELKWRGKVRVGVCLTPEELDRASWGIKEQVYTTMRIMSMLVLHDEFGFGKKRLNQFNERFNRKVDSLAGNYATWDDYAGILKDECGIESFEVDWIK